MWLAIYLICHVICGVISFGLQFAYFQREFPYLAKECYLEDIIKCALCSLAGPINLIVAFLHLGSEGMLFKHGLKFK